MAIPDYQSLMLPLLQISADGETSIPEVEPRIAEHFGLSQEERAALVPSGRQRVLNSRLHWAKSYLSRAGLLDMPRWGRFILSEAGTKLLEKKPPSIDVDLLLTYPAFEEFYRGKGAKNADGPEVLPAGVPAEKSKITPEEQIEAADVALKAALRAELLQRIQQNTPAFFEQVIVSLLVAMGYGGSRRNAAEQLGRSGDGGVDGVINEDRLGLDRVYVQAKRYAEGSPVGRPAVQAFVGSLIGLGAAKGVFVTTSTFSEQAVEYARHVPQRIILIDGYRLAELMVEHNVGVRISQAIEFKRLDEDFFAED